MEKEKQPGATWDAGASLPVRAAWCILLAALVTAVTVQYSMLHGKLIYPAQYDDVNYMLGGLRWLEALQSGGVGGWIKTIWTQPPHSPFSSGLALLCFALLGRQDWAVYAGNFVVVLTYLLMADQLLKGMRAAQRIGALLFAASVPLTSAAVFHFRPDALCGMVTAFALVMAVWNRALGANSLRRAVCLGLLLAAALLIKPSVFAMTLIVALAGITTAVAAEQLGARQTFSAGKIAARIGVAFGVMTLVTLPYYLLCGQGVFKYMWENIFGASREMWVLPGGFWEQAGYYLTGYGGHLQLGWHLWLLAAIAIGGLAWGWKHWERGKIVRLTGLLALAAGIYALVTANAVKNEFFGLTFQVLLVFSALIVLKEFLTESPGNFKLRSRTAILLVWVLAAAGASLFYFQMPQVWGERGNSGVAANRRMVDDVKTILLTEAKEKDVILVTTNGHVRQEAMLDHHMINANLLNYLFLRDRGGTSGATPVFDQRYFREPSKGFSDELATSDFLVASEPGDTVPFDFQPSSRHEQEWLDAVLLRTDWHVIGHFVGASGKGYYVFRHERQKR